MKNFASPTFAKPAFAKPVFAPVVRRVRGNLGLNKSQLSQLIGVSPASVTLWEQGKNPEGASLRLLHVLDERLQQAPPKKSDLEKVAEALAIGAAALGLALLLGALFKGK